MKVIRTSVDIDRGIYRELRRILLEREKTFAEWVRDKIREEIRSESRTRRG